MVGMISDALRNQHTGTSVGNDERIPNDPQKGPDEATAAYLKLLDNANTELYPGCKNFTSLSFIVRLLHMKVLHKLSNKTIDKFLTFYHEAFPEALNLPNSYYEAQKITDDLGFTYKTWDACPRSCSTLNFSKVRCLELMIIKFNGSILKHFMLGSRTMYVQLMLRTSNTTFSEEIHRLAIGPHTVARRFSGYVINGFRFRVKSIDDNRSTQNSGVVLKANTLSYASRKDKNPRVNFNHLLYREDQATNEPYILASQAEQVWYVPDPIEPDWQVVIKMSQRGLYDMHSDDPQVDPYLTQQLEENIGRQDEDIGWVREREEGDIIDEDV
ncbi:hypothetical protein RHGRI_007681 [Rhododendron griersonianum]|uniref:DUF4216 domain-containing protein n=1 Tax=Rhododendron griersonianum TaxID=479676 RepID=A0AAV6KZ59_9ERIC|nr:hypothetical protein RHGRI_007681 [Rhododendron griersonianum]